MSIQDIQQNPQDISNFYLANTYLATINPNVSSSLPISPPPFSPPNYAVWVNARWFLSLVISLTCALLATLLQQWARRYLKVTQTRYSPHKRARIRSFFAEGVENCLLPWVVETLPTLVHISLSLFFAGLVVFLFNVNMTIFKLLLSWVGVCTALYGCITLMPIFRHDSPYSTPLSLPVWNIVAGTSYVILRALRRVTHSDYFSARVCNHLYSLERSYRKLLVHGIQKTAEETALKLSSDIDARAFMWTFDCLDEDHELERFFSGLPGLRSSNIVHNLLTSLAWDQKWAIRQALTGLLDRTLSSDLLPAPIKNRRAMICAKAVDPVHIYSFNVLGRILSEYRYRGPLATGIVKALIGWRNNWDEGVLPGQVILSTIVARVQPRDDSWFILASKALGISEAVLRDYAAHGDSLSLAILIHVTCQQFIHFQKNFQPDSEFSSVLEAASRFDAKDTLPELQHEFCVIWNQIVRQVQKDGDQIMAFRILGCIRNVYLALHKGTDSAPTRFSAFTSGRNEILVQPSAYPLCTVPGHHPESTPHIYEDSASTSFALVEDPHDNNDAVNFLVPFCLDSPDPPSMFADAPPLENNMSVSVSLKPVEHTTNKRHSCIPATLLNPVTTCATLGNINTSSRTTHISTPEPSASTPPRTRASTSPPDAEHTAVGLTHSGALDVPSSPFLVPDNMLPTSAFVIRPSYDRI